MEFFAYVNQMRIAFREGGAVYLAIPILSGIQDKLKIFTYGSILGILLVAVMPLLSKLFGIPYNSGLTPGVVNGYILLSMIGYVLAGREFKSNERIIVYILGVIGWAIHFWGTNYLSDPGTIDTTFKGYLNLPEVLQAAGVFLFVKYHTPKNEYLRKMISWISGRTLGIYLIHFYTIAVLTKNLKADITSISWRTGGAVLVFTFSACIIWIMQKIPFVKKLVP